MKEFLVADIGGTNTRIAVGDGEGTLRNVRTYRNDELSDLPSALNEALAAGGGRRPRAAVIAFAGIPQADEIKLTNRDWRFCCSDLKRQLQLDRLLAVNDFCAVARALPHLHAESLIRVREIPGAQGNLLACGPGTGFGVAPLIHYKNEQITFPTECGHMRLGATNEREAAILDKLRKDGPPAVENVLSGRGLEAVFRLQHGLAQSSNEILEAALVGDEAALATTGLVLRIFGRAAGDLCLAFHAFGGIYIGGGIGRALAPLISDSFFDAFDDHPPYSEKLSQVPVTVINHPAPGLVGALAIARTEAA